jgi:predicted nucleotidyltransferase
VGADPTAYPALNSVLSDLTASVQDVLGTNLCGVYLQGSFAVGDADEHSDVDFIVVTHRKVSGLERAGLQAMHERLFTLAVPWAQHLEGSYVTKRKLRRVDPDRSPLLYIDNGSTQLEMSNHCNTAVVRWSLREHGIVLVGPEPRTLIDPVSEAQLRSEAVATSETFARWMPYLAKQGFMSEWTQSFLVLMFVRILQTLESGRVGSKVEAAEWAIRALDPRWRPLIQQAIAERPDTWLRVHRRSAPEPAAATHAFVAHALTKVSGYRN